ncbi:MAG: hypothetical protein FJ291_13340 [Planctomycetes bacterium]|nr:hypothetical protein [Planctomycetota bacterium]
MSWTLRRPSPVRERGTQERPGHSVPTGDRRDEIGGGAGPAPAGGGSSIATGVGPWDAHLLPVLVVKDTPEMEEMALGACRVLAGQEQARRCVPPE